MSRFGLAKTLKGFQQPVTQSKKESTSPAVIRQASAQELTGWNMNNHNQLNSCHFTQSLAWLEVKQRQGWRTECVMAEVEGTSAVPMVVYKRDVPLMGTLCYAPKLSADLSAGQLSSLTSGLREHLDGFALKVELEEAASRTDLDLENFGWTQSGNVQYKATILVDLQPPEEEVLAGFQKRARYEIGRSEREGVIAKEVAPTREKLALLYELMRITGDRSGCYLRSKEYMLRYWQSFIERGEGKLFMAYHDHDLLAASFVIQIGNRGWYKDSGSVRHKSKLAASRLLQWQIMRTLKENGCRQYDLGGVPPRDLQGSHPMDGLYTFKSGFNPDVTEYLPAYDLALKTRYRLWRIIEPLYVRAYTKVTGNYWY